MRERLVRFCHAVDVVLLLHRSAASVGRIHKFADKAVFHGLLASVAGVQNDPSDRERVAAVTRNFERHLIGRTADAA